MKSSRKLNASDAEQSQAKTSFLNRRRRISPLCLSLSLCLLNTSAGFLVKSPAFAVARHKRPALSIQRSLYTSEFDTLNQTDSFSYASGVGISPRKTLSRRETIAEKSIKSDSSSKFDLNLILIDHYDSFTYNLYDLLAQLCEKPPIVLAKDAYRDWSQIQEIYGPDKIDGIILSPGPGTPTHPDDIGTLSPSIIQKNPSLPILGVCLGHQIMGHVYGAKVDLCATGPVHGQVRPIEQQSTEETDPLWNNIPTRFNVTRYHSLAVSLPDAPQDNSIPLKPTAYSGDHGFAERILMGMSHTDNPHFGVQFHPESIGSEYGHQLLRNFCDVCIKRKHSGKGRANRASIGQENAPQPQGHDRQTTVNGLGHAKTTEPDRSASNMLPKPKYKVYMHKIPKADLSPLEVFEEFLAEEQHSVWLDTSMGVQSASQDTAQPSYSSILGAGRHTIEYFGKEHEESNQGLFCYDADKDSTVRSPHDDILTFLQEEHARATDAITMVNFENDNTIATTDLAEDAVDLPFDFRGGHVGYLGYEVRHDSERFLEEEEHGSREKWKPLEDSLLSPLPPKKQDMPKERTPTAAFLLLDKSWVYDHSADDWYLISLVDESNNEATQQRREKALDWMRSTAEKMKYLSSKNQAKASATSAQVDGMRTGGRNGKSAPSATKFVPNRSRVCYNQNFADCQEQIRLGESYELCLTNQLEADVTLPAQKSPLDLYKLLRRRNPAPFSAFLNWNTSSGGGGKQGELSCSSLAVCCSSPERFVSVKRMPHAGSRGEDGTNESGTKLQVEAKPIKGTCARVIPQNPVMGMSVEEAEEDRRRASELNASVKNRAENLMIVDLLRNDLSRVCEIGSVHVSKLMDIESYATVHQMVSTIRGTLNSAKANSVDVLKATFPGGSMTGAPKIRTMEILERLEEGVSRGPYSGCLGYMSMNGSMDMNIVIRSAVLTPKADSHQEDERRDWKVSIGAGGAITSLSESTDEYEEMFLKASAVMKAVEEWADDFSPVPAAEELEASR